MIDAMLVAWSMNEHQVARAVVGGWLSVGRQQLHNNDDEQLWQLSKWHALVWSHLPPGMI